MDIGNIKTKVLVVDDSKLIRVAAEQVLKDEFQVVFAEDGDLAWSAITNDSDIRVVFSDITMPNLDGLSLLQKIRQSDNNQISRLPTIIMTTDADDDNRRATALQFGATDFISKPFNSSDLKARARAHATSEKIARELQHKADILEKTAARDTLSGLNNKSYLLEKLAQDYSYANRHQSSFALVKLELKEFNQALIQEGKGFCNLLVKKIAESITQLIREEYTSSRVSPSSFVILMPGTDQQEVESCVSSLRESLAAMNLEFANGNVINFSLGAAVYFPELNDRFRAEAIFNGLERLANNLFIGQNDLLVTQNDQLNAVSSKQQQELNTNNSDHIDGLSEIFRLIDSKSQDQALKILPDVVEKLLPLLSQADKNTKLKIVESLKSK